MTLQQKIKACCDISDITLTELANKLGMSQQNFSKRLKVGKFKQDELEQIASILGCKYTSSFVYPNGSKVE